MVLRMSLVLREPKDFQEYENKLTLSFGKRVPSSITEKPTDFLTLLNYS